MTAQHPLNLAAEIKRLIPLAWLALCVAALVGATTAAFAQDEPEPGAQPDRGVKAGAYSVSDIENINLVNGNLNLSIPLASLPPVAGGKLSWTIRAEYSSKLWDLKTVEHDPDSYHSEPYTTQRLSRSNDGGWRIGKRYSLELHTSDEVVQTTSCQGDLQCYFASFRYKYILVAPDGARHEMRPLDAPVCSGCPAWRTGYYSQTPATTGTTMRYYSFDGSYLWATVTPAGGWTVYMKDGSRVTQGTDAVQRVYDVNGNSVKIYSETDGAGVTTTHYVDEHTGREIRNVYDPALNRHRIQYQTVGGAWMNIDVNFGNTTVQGLRYNIYDRVCTQVAYGVLGLQVARSVVLPQTEPGQPARQFTFSYNSDTLDAVNFQYRPACGASFTTVTSASHGWGSLSRVVMPSGAQVDYTYSLDGDPGETLLLGNAKEVPRETITQKKITHDGGTIDTWTYQFLPSATTVTAPDGATTKEDYFYHDPGDSSYLAGPQGTSGLVFRTTRSDKVVVERKWALKIFDGANSASPDGLVNFNTVVEAEYTTLKEGGANVKMAAKTFQYDFNGNLTQVAEYDWFDPALVTRDSYGVPTGVPAGATLRRTTTTAYYNPAAASSSANVYAKRAIATATPLVLSAPQEAVVGASQTRYSYDNQTYGSTPTVGNLTQVSRWDSAGNKWLNTGFGYDAYGNRTSVTDPKNNVTTYVYGDSTHALPTQVSVNPLNGTGAQTTTTAYDYATGSVIDEKVN